MKKISYWARQNPWPARIIIVIGHLILFANAIYLGLFFASNDWIILPWHLISFSIVLSMAMFLYPVRGIRKGIFKHSYRRQKIMDGILILCSFLLIAGTSNRYANLPAAIPQEGIPLTEFMVYKPSDQKVKKKPTARDFKRALKKMRKQARKSLRLEKKQMQANRNGRSKAGNIILTILLVLGIVFLWGLILNLSCSLSCSGNVGMAWFVFIGGTAGLIVLTILLIKVVWTKR